MKILMKLIPSVAVLLIVLVYVVFAGNEPVQIPPTFEYKFVYKVNEQICNDLGAQGWELVTQGPGPGIAGNMPSFVFKRVKK